jgi:hypothetical protein
MRIENECYLNVDRGATIFTAIIFVGTQREKSCDSHLVHVCITHKILLRFLRIRAHAHATSGIIYLYI